MRITHRLEVNVRHGQLFLHLLCQLQSQLINNNIQLRSACKRQILQTAFTRKLQSCLYAGLLQQLQQSGIFLQRSAIAKNIDNIFRRHFPHQLRSGSQCSFNTRQMVPTLKMFRTHQQNRHMVLFLQLINECIIVITDDFQNAGCYQNYALRRTCLKNFGNGLFCFLNRTEGNIIIIYYYRNTAFLKTAEDFHIRQQLGIICAFICTDDNRNCLRHLSYGHQNAHQRAMSSREGGCHQRFDIPLLIYFAQASDIM